MKIGILTHYHGNHNYGGLLQSYALPMAIEHLLGGTVAQQIPCVYILKPCTRKRQLLRYTDPAVWADRIIYLGHQFLCRDRFQAERDLFRTFEGCIPHMADSVLEGGDDWTRLTDCYDAFIVGSDQVWNPNWFYAPFYLPFVPENQLKIAYGASLGVSHWHKDEQEALLPLIRRFDHISVREKSAETLLAAAGVSVTHVCDPVWLLDVEQWNQIAQPPAMDAPYIYTYLLGHRKENRKIATRVGELLQLPLANAPYVRLLYNTYDYAFGQIKLHGVGPSEFLGLIRESHYVVTDSFHGILFALLYQRPFIALLRHGEKDSAGFNGRITDLLSELGLSHRVVRSLPQVTRALLEEPIDFSAVQRKIDQKKQRSLAFLSQVLYMDR